MRSHQKMEVTFPINSWNPLRTIFAVWNSTGNRIRESRETARQERVVSRLSPHLRHDMGDLDCPPQPQPLSETLKSRRQTLETMWRL